jgi:outer membrane protease
MKKRAFFLSTSAALLLLAALPSRADPPQFTLSAGPKFGAFYGVANEYVYNQSLSPDYKNSWLVWPLQPMVFSGAALSLESTVGFFATLDVRQGFAGSAGTMTDSDYLNGDGQRTHFSQSDSHAERANLVDFRLGWDFYRGGAFTIGAFGAFSYMDLKWTAKDGYYQYPTSGAPYSQSPFVPGTYTPWSASETKTPLYGTGIIYETTYVGGAVGIRTRYAFSSLFAISGSFAFTPILTCYTEDDHVLRQIAFYSTLTGGFMIEPRVAVEYTPDPRALLKFEVGYRYAWNLKGDLTEVNSGASDFSGNPPYVAGPNSSATFSNASGADFMTLDASLSLSIAL